MKVSIKTILLSFLFPLLYSGFALAINKTSIGSGNWNSQTTWVPAGIPAATDDVTIKSGHSVIVNGNSTCNKITIEKNAYLEFSASKALVLNSDCIIEGTCNVTSGILIQNTSGALFTLGQEASFIWDPAINDAANATIFTKSTESFHPTSTISINQWYDLSVPFASVISGNIGNIIFKTGSSGWSQKNEFATHIIYGTLTIDSDYIIMDDVNSSTTSTININEIVLASNTSKLDFFTGERTGGIIINAANIAINYGELNLFNNNGNGTCTLNVSGNIIIQKDGVFAGANNHNGNTNINVDNDFTINGGIFYGANDGDGNSNVTINGNFYNLISSRSGEYYGIVDGNGNATLTVNGNLNNSGYMDLIWNSGVTGVGNGNAVLNVKGDYIQSQGDFRGIFNITTTNAGNVTMSLNNIAFTGGIFMASYSCNFNPAVNNINITGNLNINFTSPDDIFRFNGLSTLSGISNNAELILNINGSLIINGNESAEFRTNGGNGNETVSITGNTTFNGGNNYFNYSSGHNSLITFNGNVLVSGGNTSLSYSPGNSMVSLRGNLSVTGGSISLKNNIGSTSLILIGSFIQTDGTTYINGSNNTISADQSSLTVNGDFNHIGGIISYNNFSTCLAPNIINVNGTKFNIGGTGKITTSAGEEGNCFGTLNFNSSSIIEYNRTGSHLLEKVRQYITSGTTLNATSNIQISSCSIEANDMLTVNNGSTLELYSNKIQSNMVNAYSGITIASGGLTRTSHVNGFYNGTSNASVDATGSMNYFLDPNSTIEYNGNTNQVITGIGSGNANGDQHKYGKLLINSAEAAGVNYVYPENNNVYIRSQLNLQNGEFYLNDKTVTIVSGSPDAIIRTSGYIKSETNAAQNNAVIKWQNVDKGNYLIPFGVNQTGYIPVTMSVTEGGPVDMNVSTRATGSDNQPWTTNIPYVNSSAADISQAAVIDRWWDITSSAPCTADITLSYLGSENSIATPTLPLTTQVYNNNTWSAPNGNTNGVTKGTGTVTANGISTFGSFIIVGATYALSVNLSYFTVQAQDGNAVVQWATTSEKNNDFFTIEKTENGQTWVEVQKINGAGNSSTIKYYSYIDKTPFEGKSYYRIKQTDYSGTFSYTTSRPFYKDKNASAENAITGIRPNPFESTFTMQFVMEEAGEAEIFIHSSSGKLVYQNNLEVLKGINYFDFLQTSTMPIGYYTLTLKKGTTQLTRKLIKNN
jgi:G8 domain